MSRRRIDVSLELATFVAVMVVTVARAPGGPGWFGDGDAVVASGELSPLGGHSPLAIIAGALAGLVPIGEPAFRLALVGAVAVAACAAGVVALVRALTPTAAGAGAVAAALCAITPAAAGGVVTADGAIAAALVVWILAGVAAQARDAAARADGRDAAPWSRARAVAGAAMVGALGAVAPLCALCAAVPVAIVHWGCTRWRGRMWGAATAIITFALAAAPLLLRGQATALAALPSGSLVEQLGVAHRGAGLAAVIARIGDGAGAVLLLGGLVGLGLGAATGLRSAATVLAIAAATVAAIAITGSTALALCALAPIAAGLGPLTAAVARLAQPDARATVATVAAIPIAAIAAFAPRHTAPPPAASDGVARVADDLLGAVDPGPGLFVSDQPVIDGALRHERAIAGLRPDLATVRAFHGAGSERAVVAALRAGYTVAADRPNFGQLDPRRSRPAGRGFVLVLGEPADDDPPPPPAHYPDDAGRAISGWLAVERGRREAARGHLDRAAAAAGLVVDAGERALLAAAVPTALRPPLYGFVPPLTRADLPPAWLPALFDDDLAWVAGLARPPLPATAPPERRLHALWRDVLAGRRAPDDPDIAALGLPAARATAEMLGDLGHAAQAEQAARAVIAHHEDAATLMILGSLLADRGGVGQTTPLDEPHRHALIEAEQILGRAAAADPADVDALIVRGLVQHRLGQVEDARRTWQAADRLAPGRPDLADLLKGP